MLYAGTTKERDKWRTSLRYAVSTERVFPSSADEVRAWLAETRRALKDGRQSVEGLRVMFEAEPQGAERVLEGAHGGCMLHVACRFSSHSLELLRVLHEACPGSAKAQDDLGRTPLHVLVSANPHQCGTVRWLLSVCAEAGEITRLHRKIGHQACLRSANAGSWQGMCRVCLLLVRAPAHLHQWLTTP